MSESAIMNDRRTILGWTMYDWANSAYSTTIAGAILPAYFTAVRESKSQRVFSGAEAGMRGGS